MILITGASGFIGTNLLRTLTDKQQVKCLFQASSDVAALEKYGPQLCKGDLEDPSSLDSALQDVTAVVHLAAVTSETSPDYELSYRVNVLGTKNLMEACKRNKVRRFITLSSESTKRPQKGAYAKTKEMVDEMLRKSDLEYTILRPSIVYGRGAKGLFAKMLDYIEVLPIVPVVGSGEQKIKPILVDDVTDAIMACLDRKNTVRKEYDLTGPDKITFNTFTQDILHFQNIEKRLLHLPFPLVYVGAKLAGMIMKNPPVTTDNLLGLKQDVDMDYAAATRDFGFSPADFQTGLARTFYTTDTRKPRIVVIGMGKMGILHASLINQMSQAELVAVADVSAGLRSHLKSMGIKATFFTSVDTMLDLVRPDGAIICVPPFLNRSISEKCLKRGMAVLTEKPLADTLENAKAMVGLARENKCVTATGFMASYVPTFEEARRLLERGEIGRVEKFESYFYISQVLAPKSKKSWYYDRSKSGGGCIPIMGSHLLFVLHTFFGAAEAVRGSIKSIFTDMDDAAEFDVRYRSGVSGKVQGSWSVRGYPYLELGIQIDGEEGRLIVTKERLEITRAGKTVVRKISALPDGARFELGDKGYYSQDADFIEAVKNGTQVRSNWDESIAVQALMDAMWRAASSGKNEEV